MPTKKDWPTGLPSFVVVKSGGGEGERPAHRLWKAKGPGALLGLASRTLPHMEKPPRSCQIAAIGHDARGPVSERTT